MLQAVLKDLQKIELKETTPRVLKKGEIRLKVISCAICGSDIRIYNYGNPRVKLPHVIGHEVVGEIIEVSEGCSLNIGDFCCFGADLPCGKETCEYCKNGNFCSCDDNLAIGYQYDGGFAETMIIPEVCWKYGAFKIIHKQNNIKDLYKYSLIEPLACAFHGVTQLSVKENDRVLIFGGGPIGLMIGDICYNVFKCKSVTIIELSQARINLIHKMFPHFIVEQNFSNIKTEYDVIFTANSVPECHKNAIEVASKNARINLFGGLGKSDLVAIDTNKIHYKQLIVTGTHGSRLEDFEKAFDSVEKGQINVEKYITAIYDLKDINVAFESAKNLNNLKIIIKNS